MDWRHHRYPAGAGAVPGDRYSQSAVLGRRWRRLSLQNFATLFHDARFYQAVGNTLLAGAGATVLSCLLGFALAWIVSRTDLPGRRWFEILNLVPFFLSPYVGAVAWIYLAAPNSGMLQHWLGVLGIPLDFIRIYSIGGVSLGAGPVLHALRLSLRHRADAADGRRARGCGAGARCFVLVHAAARDDPAADAVAAVGRAGGVRDECRACSTCRWRWPQPAASAPCRRRSSSRCNTRRISVARRPSASWSWRRRSSLHPAAAISRQAPVRNGQREGLSAPADRGCAGAAGWRHSRSRFSTSPAAWCCPRLSHGDGAFSAIWTGRLNPAALTLKISTTSFSATS